MDIAPILFFHRLHGYLDTAPAMWAAQRLLEKDPTPAAIHYAHALLRQALALSPLDADLANLLVSLSRQAGIPWDRPLASDQSTKRQLLDPECANDICLEKLTSASPGTRHVLLSNLWTDGHAAQVFLQGTHHVVKTDPENPGLPLLAWALHALGDEDGVRQALKQTQDSFLAANLCAHLALEGGDEQAARACLLRSLSLEPAQPHVIEKLAQLDLWRTALPDPQDFKTHILFYTFNKLDTTLSTLRSLLDSDIGQARITVLNNGSTLFSPEEFAAGVARTAQGRSVDVIQLPVNIGAPAARNWLYHLPEVREARYVAFLDDDVLLPKNWLRLYLQDLQDHPEVCAVGPKGINPNPFRTIQYVYRYFQEVGERKIRFTNNAPMAWDLGQFDGRRPCLSVMGCCHIFDRKKLSRLGVPDFDVRFTPSQVDDLERDIQIWKHGGQVLYDGRVEVVHLQDAGRAAPKTEASWGHVWGNHMKMEAKFSGRELEEIDRKVKATEEKHWQECLAKAWDQLPESCRAFWRRQTADSMSGKKD